MQILKDSQRSTEEIKKADSYIKTLTSEYENARLELSEHKSSIELLKQQIVQKEEMLGVKDNDASSAKMELSKQ